MTTCSSLISQQAVEPLNKFHEFINFKYTLKSLENDVVSTSFRRHVPTKFLINQCQIITYLILKSDNIENSRLELKEIVLPVPSNQIKVTFIIILPLNLVHL